MGARRAQVLESIERIGGRDPLTIGSVARGEDTSQPDLDLVSAFSPEVSMIGLLSLEDELSALLTVPVDVISAHSSAIHNSVPEDAVRV